MTDKDISRVEPKGVKRFKAFNAAFKDGQGYELPEGGIYLFNDVERNLYEVIKQPVEIKSKDHYSKVRSSTHPDHAKMKQSAMDETNVFKIVVVDNDDYHTLSQKTKFRSVFDAFCLFYKQAVYAGRIGVFRRLDENNANVSPDLLSNVSFETMDAYGFLFSSEELFDLLDQFKDEYLKDEHDKFHANALKDSFANIFSLCPDYSGIKFEAVNAPIPQSKLKKPAVRANLRSSVSMNGTSP